MTPRNPFSGQAPAAMAQMGAGLSEAGARIGQFNYQGLADFGKGMASGISTGASQYASFKDAKSAVSALEKTAGLVQDPQQQQALKDFLADDNITTRQKAQMGMNLFNTLLDYGMKYTMQQNDLASRERIAGMRAAGGGGATGGLLGGFSTEANPSGAR